MSDTLQKNPAIWESTEPTRQKKSRLVACALGFPLIFAAVIISVQLLFTLVFHMSEKFAAVFGTVAGELVIIALFVLVTQDVRHWRKWTGLENCRIKDVLIGVGVGILFIIGLMIVNMIAYAISGSSSESSETTQILSSFHGPLFILVFCVMTPLIIPIIEEVLFRGLIRNFITVGFHATKRAHVVAVVINALFFGLAHWQGGGSWSSLLGVIYPTFIAIMVALLAIRYKSLFPAIAAHATYNAITVVFVLLSL